jgi:hypothetical protein
MKQSLCSEKFETFEIWAMFTSESPHIVMSRTDAQNGLDGGGWHRREKGWVNKILSE